MNWHLVLTENNVRRLVVGDYPDALGGVALTLLLTAVGIVCSTLLGLLVGYLRFAGTKPLRVVATVYVEFLRNIPLLVLIFWAYFAPPYFGFTPSKFSSVLVALVLFNAAYIAEVVRSGLLSVSVGQIEAARAIGMSSVQQALFVMLPIAAFNTVPAMTSRLPADREAVAPPFPVAAATGVSATDAPGCAKLAIAEQRSQRCERRINAANPPR